jgi:ESS family glutamate:Na+ symporter
MKSPKIHGVLTKLQCCPTSDGAVMVAGLVGFGVGSTATAVAAMNAIVRRRGPAPRAQAIVPATGGFLIDLTNAPTTTAFLQWLR